MSYECLGRSDSLNVCFREKSLNSPNLQRKKLNGARHGHYFGPQNEKAFCDLIFVNSERMIKYMRYPSKHAS